MGKQYTEAVTEKTLKPLMPTLLKLMGRGTVGLNAVVTILASEAEEVGAKILNAPTEPLEGTIVNRS
jgi:hypothetical protein